MKFNVTPCFIFVVLLLFLKVSFVAAEIIYVSQTALDGDTGGTAADAHSI